LSGELASETTWQPSPRALPQSIDETLEMLSDAGYVADRALATVLFLSLRMQRPLFPGRRGGRRQDRDRQGAGRALGRRLIRLQCYEGSTSPPPSMSGTMPPR
jgi:hypothetical protein